MASSNPVLIYPPKKRRTGLYCRVGSGGQGKGLESQVRALRLYCDQNKIENYSPANADDPVRIEIKKRYFITCSYLIILPWSSPSFSGKCKILAT